MRLRRLTLALALCLCLFGCSGEEAPPEPSSVPAPLTPSPEPVTVTAQNPVSIFYSDYYSASRDKVAMLEQRLGLEPTYGSTESLLYLALHNLHVSEGLVTFGYLLSTDTAHTFSSSVTGAAQGAGTISVALPGYDPNILPDEPVIQDAPAEEESGDVSELPPDAVPTVDPALIDDTMPTLPIIPIITPTPTPFVPPEPSPTLPPHEIVYLLRFSYDSGNNVFGTLKGSSLIFAEDASGIRTALYLEDGVWVSEVTHPGGLLTSLVFDEAGVRFTVARGSGAARQELYAWVSDSSGVKDVL